MVVRLESYLHETDIIEGIVHEDSSAWCMSVEGKAIGGSGFADWHIEAFEWDGGQFGHN